LANARGALCNAVSNLQRRDFYAGLQAQDMQRLLDIANAMRPVLTHAQAGATRQLRNAAEAQGRTMQTQARATIDLASADVKERHFSLVSV